MLCHIHSEMSLCLCVFVCECVLNCSLTVYKNTIDITFIHPFMSS